MHSSIPMYICLEKDINSHLNRAIGHTGLENTDQDLHGARNESLLYPQIDRTPMHSLDDLCQHPRNRKSSSGVFELHTTPTCQLDSTLAESSMLPTNGVCAR
mmetsp:Transcript_3598/g.6831  ORF Transcript_3598/g.6831 Transcript_3598/m.6831 type:complete len:102 (+) Transcript_3598:936-1241(+)